MKIIIVGCGRLGSGLAVALEEEGNQVTVISNDARRLRQLETNFSGMTIKGVEFDKDVLERANIQRVDSLISCTESDETNALVARIARNVYQVPKVIARLYDQRKVDIYNALGIQVIATTEWGVSRAKELLTFSQMETVLSIGNQPVEILRIDIPELLVGKKLVEVFPLSEARVVALARGNQSFIPAMETQLEKNDIVYIAVMSTAVEKISHVLGL